MFFLHRVSDLAQNQAALNELCDISTRNNWLDSVYFFCINFYTLTDNLRSITFPLKSCAFRFVVSKDVTAYTYSMCKNELCGCRSSRANYSNLEGQKRNRETHRWRVRFFIYRRLLIIAFGTRRYPQSYFLCATVTMYTN